MTHYYFPADVVAALNRHRQDAQITIREVAEDVGVSERLVQYWHAGKSQPTLEQVFAYAICVNVELSVTLSVIDLT
jgi:transcriptional regulator with XRE-family HTH domain